MNQLAMGPLPVRRSAKEDTKIVFLCGVRVCREVLADWDLFNLKLKPGYAPNGSGVFIKNRQAGNRAGNRYDFHKRNAWQREDDYAFDNTIDPKTTEEAVRDSKARELTAYQVPIGAGQIVIRCARCGNLSKITTSECKHLSPLS